VGVLTRRPVFAHAQEQAAIEAEALLQMEIRRAKFTSEEAVRRSRLAVQRRVASKLARLAEQEKEKEDSEVGKKEKMRQVRLRLLFTCS
jgi:RecA/RadA recombinase